MPEYKLVYFDTTGKAELLRWMFKVAGVEFEDCRLRPGDWPGTVREESPFGQVPVLYIDGKAYCQSWSLAKFLSKEFGMLAGGNNLEDLMIDQIGYSMDDFVRKVEPLMPRLGFPPEVRAEKRKKLEEEQLPQLFGYLDKLLESNNGGTGWFVGDKMTWADMAFAHYVTLLEMESIGVAAPWKDFPKLQALKERVEAHPRIAEWMRTRPVVRG